MSINITPEDTILFEQNGYTYNDIKNTVEHYRSNGLTDNDIQSKLNTRLEEFRNINRNESAFNNTINLDKNNDYVKQCDYNLEQLSSLYFSPEELKEIDNKGAINWWELAKKTDKTERVPFAGEIESSVKAGKLGIISKKIEKGEEISSDDKAFLNNYMREYIEVARRGTTWGAKVANVLLDIPAWAVEIGAITASTGGLGSIPAIAKKVATKSGAKAATAYTTKAIVKSVQKAGVKGATLNVAKTNAILAPRIAENYAQRRISEGIAITDKGEAYLQEIDEKPTTTIIKALADTNIELATETIGGQSLNLAGTLAAKSVAGKAVSEGFKRGFDLLPKKTRVAFESAVQKLRPNETIESLIKKGGFNGVLAEMGEERIADILKTTLDLDAEEGYSADQFMQAIKPSAEQLLVELGAFSILGGASKASSIIYNNLRVKGYNHEEATNVVNNLSEIEKDNLVNSEIVQDNFTVNSDVSKEDIIAFENAEKIHKNFIENNKYFNKNKYDIAEVEIENYKNYSKLAEKVIQNPKKYSDNIPLGQTMESLIEAGLDNLPLETAPHILSKMQHKKDHKIKSNTIKKLPYLLNNPVAIFESNSTPNSVIVLIDAKDKDNLPVMVSISKNNTENTNEVNFITSGYGRKKMFFANLIKNNKLIKINKNIPTWLQELLTLNDTVSNSNSVNVDTNKDTNIITDNLEGYNPSVKNREDEQKTAEQKLEEYKQNIREYKKVKKESERLVQKLLAPISTELDIINPKLKTALRRFEMETALKENEYAKPVKAFINAADKMEREDYLAYDLALKNRNVELVNALNKKYGIEKEYEAIRQLLDGIYKEAQEVGMDFGQLEDYFPRKVINPAAFIEEVSKSTFVKKALKELDPNNKMTNEDKAIAVNNILRGYGNKISLSSNFAKERRVQEITPELNAYYKDSMDALTDYIQNMNNVIQAKKFFGKGENVEDSVGAYVKSLAEQGLISARDEARAKEILMSRFAQRGTGELLSTFKNISYLSTMGSPLSAITQIGDLAFSLYKNGFYDSLIGFNQALSGKGITREDLGIEKIAQEFSEKSKTSQAVSTVFKLVGLDFMDRMGKETFINASYKRLKDLANNSDAKFNNMLTQIFGKEAKQVKEDLQNDILSQNVKYLLFSELSDFQPVSLAEMPEKYLTGGNARIFYQLKTYTIKQLDVYRNQIFRQFKDNPQEAMANMIKLSAMLVIANATADVLKDLLLGRPIDLDDLVIDNLLRLIGFSKWQVYKARREGLFTTLLQSILPPTNILDDLYKDTVKTIDNGELSINDLNIIKDIPLAGKLYYWWFGKGSKIEEKSGVYDKFSKTYNKAKKANDKLKDLQGEDAVRFTEKKEKELENYRALKSYDRQIKKLRQQRKRFEEIGNREGIKAINNQIDEIAKAALEAIR